MTTAPVEANVVLTADNTQYDQAMDQSSQSTDKLAKSLDTLGTKINNITKSAGKKMIGFAAADVALITGATAAWASYEKQMSRLQAQSAIITHSRSQETQVMKDYTDSVRSLRKEFGTTTSEAAELTQAISKMGANTRQIKELASTFEAMSQATGESSSNLATSQLQLQKMMGSSTTTESTKKYADQLTYLSAKSNTTATALADFASQIAPMGRAMGMGQTQVTGFANMFIKAGQDGYTAATAFNKVAQDITYAVQTGSPDLNKYANLLGVTVEHFKGMSGAEQVAGFLDRISSLGPKAAMELNRFGFDGIRMAKAITATVQSSGGAMNALTEARVGYGSDSVDKGAKAAENMTTVLAKVRQEMQMTAESFANVLGPGIVIVLKGIELVAGAFNDLMSGPMGKFIQIAGAVLVPIAAIGGALALLAGTLVKVGAAFMLFRNAGAYGLKEGLQGGGRIIAETNEAGLRTGKYMSSGGEGAYLGQRGAVIANDRRSTWWNRGTYNAGQTFGSGTRSVFGWLGGQGTEGGTQRNIWSRGTSGGIRLASDVFTSQFDQARYQEVPDRSSFLKPWFPGRGPQVGEVYEAGQATVGARAKLAGAQAVLASHIGAAGFGAEPDEKKTEVLKNEVKSAQAVVDANVKQEKAVIANATGQLEGSRMLGAANKANMSVYATMRAEGANVAKAFAGAAAGATKFAASSAVKAGSGLVGALGGPWGAAITGAMTLPMLIPLLDKMLPHQPDYQYADMSAGGSPYLKAGGIAPPVAPTIAARTKVPQSLTQAQTITPLSIAAATGEGFKGDPALVGMDAKQATAYLGSSYDMYAGSPAALNKLKLNLIHQYGAGPAAEILANLEGGNYQTGAAQFYQAARGGGVQRSSMLNAAGGLTADTINRAFTQQGSAAGFQARAKALSYGIQQAVSTTGTGGKDIVEMLNKTLGIDLEYSPLASKDKIGLAPNYGPQLPAQYNQSRALLRGTDAERLQALITADPEKSGQLKTLLGIPQKATGDDLTKAIVRRLGGKGQGDVEKNNLETISEMGPGGRLFAESGLVRGAVGLGAVNTEANVKATEEMMYSFRDMGRSAPQVIKTMGKIKSTIGDPDDPDYILADWISGETRRTLAQKMPTMTRADAFQAQAGMFKADISVQPVTDEQWASRQKAQDDMASSMSEQMSYFKQMLMMQDQYDLQRKRAEEDYNLSRTYALYDYNLQRERAEEAFNRSRARAVDDFHRSMTRATYQYNLSRKRQEEDFNHSVDIMAIQQAQSMMNIYDRVQTQRTSSASWLLSNATDQLQRMKDQEQDLGKVRKAGLSDTAIQQLGLTDPANQQQLARFVTEMTPHLIRELNKTAGSERVKATRDLMTDQSNLEWQELRRGFNLNQSRAHEDFERQMRQSRRDFRRGLDRQREDFNISMDDQAEDFKTGMDRQENQYVTTMKRAAHDISLVGKELDLSYEEVLRKSVNRLSGHAQDQAEAVLNTFKGLKSDTDPQAIAIMQSLANIFGFKYQVPKGVSTGSESLDNLERHNAGNGQYTGGVIPGWNPGRDTHQIGVGGGEAVMRPEWTRAVGGEKAVNQMNHAAIHGFLAKGGVFWPVPGHDTGTYPGHDGVDINRGSGWDDYGDPIRAFRSGKIVYVGSAHGYGDAIFENTSAANVVYGHTSAQFVRAGQSVIGGQLIGKVGSTGNSSAPHLHFGIPGGTYEQAMALLAGAIVSGGPGFSTTGEANPLAGLLKRFYPQPEHSAYRLQGVHPLQHGDISTVINRYGKRAINAMRRAFGDPVAAASGNIGNQPYEHMDNMSVVRVGAKRMGWLDQWSSLRELVEHESSFNNTAQNPGSTAYGLFQFLDGTWPTVGGHKTSDPWLQTKYGLRYIQDRYGNPINAWKHWQQYNSYGDGSIFTSPSMIQVGEKGPEAVIPLNARGGEFLGDAMARSVGMGSTPVRGGGMNLYQTRVDRSTNFSGPITVQANDPGELINKLQARQRVMALSRPALTGSAA